MRVDQEIKLSTGRVWIGEYRKRPVVVLKSGVGMKNATMSLSEVLETVCRPALVLSYGTAGALSLDLRIGELVLVDKLWVSSSTQVLNVEPELLEGARAWLHRSGIVYRQGGLVTSPGIVDQESNRDLLFHTYRALGVDMESAVICRMAKAYGLPFLCVRAISDRADGSLRELGDLKSTSSLAWFRTVTEILRRPLVVTKYWGFRRGLRVSIHSLSRAVNAFCDGWRRTSDGQ